MEINTNLFGRPIYSVSVRQYSQEKISLPNGRIGYQYSYQGYISQYTIRGVFYMDPKVTYMITRDDEKANLYNRFDFVLLVTNAVRSFLIGIDKNGAMYAPEYTLAGKEKEFFWTEEEAKANQEAVCEQIRNTYKNVKEVVYQ